MKRILAAWLVVNVCALRARGQAPAPALPARVAIWVDARSGDDATGDGTVDRPFKTIARALALQAIHPDRATAIHLGLGHYGRALAPPAVAEPVPPPANPPPAPPTDPDREAIPIVLPAGVSLIGFGSTSCEISGEKDQPLILLPDHGECVVSGVSLRAAGTAIAATPIARSGRLDVHCVDVAVEKCDVALDLRPAAGVLALHADGLRVRGGLNGIVADAATHLDLALARSLFRECDEALALAAANAPSAGAWQAVALDDCSFEHGAAAAVRRFGAAPLAAGVPPWRIAGCRFVGNEAGVALEIPSGDLPLSIERCDFLENANYGVTLVGGGEPREGATRITDCRFRWNGIAVNLLSCGRPVELSGCAILESTGNGVFAANFVGRGARVTLTRCLLACNGACGIQGLCEQKDGLAVTLARCTVADNRGHGVERRVRKGGTAGFALSRCIVAGNDGDLSHVEPADLSRCLIGAARLGDGSDSRVGDPRFVQREAHDFRIAKESPARLADGLLGALDDAGQLRDEAPR